MIDAATASAAGNVLLEAVPDIPKIPCVLCASPIDATARICVTCKAYQRGQECVVCGKWIPRKAIDCTECKSPQNRWRRTLSLNATVLALLISLISVVSTLGPGIVRMVNRGSQTSGFVIGSERDKPTSEQKDILVTRVINGGGQASIVNSARLDLRGAGGGFVTLDIVNRRDKQVPANGTTDLKLFAGDDDFKVLPSEGAKVIASLCTHPATLLLGVEEKNALGKTLPDREVVLPIDVKTIRSWSAQRLITTEPEACP
jgi:predicted nucleic acid-binding Zn ribbon protein